MHRLITNTRRTEGELKCNEIDAGFAGVISTNEASFENTPGLINPIRTPRLIFNSSAGRPRSNSFLSRLSLIHGEIKAAVFVGPNFFLSFRA